MMLIKYGFNIKLGDIINPTALFCNDRSKYYDFLSKADKGTNEGIVEWSIYVLEGLKEEMIKIDKISDIEYVRSRILKPALTFSLERKYLTDIEFKVLNHVISTKDMIFRSRDLEELSLGLDVRQRKTFIKKMKDNKIIKPLKNENGRNYTLSLSDSILLRSIIKVMSDEGFIPSSLNG
jgi:hypothetical protein